MVTNTITQSYPQNVTQTKQEKEPAFIHNDITVAPIMLSIIITTKIIQCTFQTTAHGALNPMYPNSLLYLLTLNFSLPSSLCVQVQLMIWVHCRKHYVMQPCFIIINKCWFLPFSYDFCKAFGPTLFMFVTGPNCQLYSTAHQCTQTELVVYYPNRHTETQPSIRENIRQNLALGVLLVDELQDLD